MFIEQVGIPDFRAVKLDTLQPVDGGNKDTEEYFLDQPLYFNIGIIQGDQLICIDGDEYSILNGLYSFARRLASNQALYPRDKRIFKFQAFCDICVAFEIVDPQCPLLDKIDRPAGMPDSLDISIFFERLRSAYTNQCFHCFRGK